MIKLKFNNDPLTALDVLFSMSTLPPAFVFGGSFTLSLGGGRDEDLSTLK